MEILGKAAIWLATLGSVASLGLYLSGERWEWHARWSFRVVAVTLVAAIGLLLTLILTHRLSICRITSCKDQW